MFLPANYCLLIFVQCGHTSQISRSLGLVFVASGSFGAVFVNLLSAILRPGWMHLHETDRSPTVMCLTNCLCLFPNGLFEGNNLVIAFMKLLLGKLWRLAYVWRPGCLSSHALETPPCLSMHCCCQARGQDEDEMAPPQQIPQSCLSLGGHTHLSVVYETSPRALPNMAVLVVVAIPVVVLFLGGVLRCRAPWFDGTNEGPCLSDFKGSQLQCVTRGHCSAGTPIFGTVGLASLQQCVKETLKTLARHAHATNSDASHGTPCCSLCPEVGQGPSAPAGLSA